MLSKMLGVVVAAAPLFLAGSIAAQAAPGGNGGGGGGGGGISTSVDCRPVIDGGAGPDGLSLKLAQLDPDKSWRLNVKGTCVGDVILQGFNNIILQAADPAPARATIEGSIVTTLTKLTLDRINISVAGNNLGLLCGGLSDCYISESDIAGGGGGADGVIVTGRSRASLVATNISNFRMGMYVNNGSTAGFIAGASQGAITNVLDGVYTLDGSFVSVEGNTDGTRAKITGPRRNGITAFNAAVRVRAADIDPVGTTESGYGLELRSGAKAHIENSVIGNKSGAIPGTGSAWPSLLLADLSHAFFVNGTPTLNGPIQCAGKYASFDTFGTTTTVSLPSIGCTP
jgi:hypothetical protein